jgi:hypothetical protein
MRFDYLGSQLLMETNGTDTVLRRYGYARTVMSQWSI